jgi:Putative zinc-finger
VNLDLGGPGPGCSALRVRRLLAGELSGAEKERTEAHLAGCERCAEVQREIVAEREALRRDVPFPQFAAAVAEKLAHRPQRSFAARFAPLAAAAGIVLIAGTALVLRPKPADDWNGIKGGGGSAQLFVQDANGVRELGAGDAVAEGARLQLSIKPEGRKQAAVVLIEPGETSVIYAGPAVKGPLPESFVWTGKGVATLLVVLSDSKVDPASIHSAADAPRGSDVLSVTLHR